MKAEQPQPGTYEHFFRPFDEDDAIDLADEPLTHTSLDASDVIERPHTFPVMSNDVTAMDYVIEHATAEIDMARLEIRAADQKAGIALVGLLGLGVGGGLPTLLRGGLEYMPARFGWASLGLVILAAAFMLLALLPRLRGSSFKARYMTSTNSLAVDLWQEVHRPRLLQLKATELRSLARIVSRKYTLIFLGITCVILAVLAIAAAAIAHAAA